MSDLEWREGNLPVSKQFDDAYFSMEDGRAETAHVFIKGNRLDERWPHMQNCTVAELGFGTGLNFLETVRQWRALRAQRAMLQFISFERFPLPPSEMRRAHAQWPELHALSRELLEIWNPGLSKMDARMSCGTRLTVHFGDANTLLPDSGIEADAWYLDGFSPAKNPELWNGPLLQAVGQYTVAGGTFATYTAAGHVRRALQEAGFEVRKTAGFGKKRDMLAGMKPSDIHVAGGH